MSISCDTLIAGLSAEIKYNGELVNMDKLFIHYGTNNWNNINEIEMRRTTEGFVAKLSIPSDAKSMEFSFRDNNNNWDNNLGENFNYTVYPESILLEDNDTSLKTSFFESDFLLESNINKHIEKQENKLSFEEILEFFKNEDEKNNKDDDDDQENGQSGKGSGKDNKDLDEFEINSYGEVVLKNRQPNVAAITPILEEEIIKGNVQNFEEELNDVFESLHSSLFSDLEEVEEELEVQKLELKPTTLFFYSKTPNVRLFKEKQVSSISNLIKIIEAETAKDKLFGSEVIANELKTAELELSPSSLLFTAKKAYMPTLKKLAAQMILELDIQKEEKITSSYLAVSPVSNLDPFDNSILATIQRYTRTIVNTFRKLQYLVKESFSREAN